MDKMLAFRVGGRNHSPSSGKSIASKHGIHRPWINVYPFFKYLANKFCVSDAKMATYVAQLFDDPRFKSTWRAPRPPGNVESKDESIPVQFLGRRVQMTGSIKSGGG